MWSAPPPVRPPPSVPSGAGGKACEAAAGVDGGLPADAAAPRRVGPGGPRRVPREPHYVPRRHRRPRPGHARSRWGGGMTGATVHDRIKGRNSSTFFLSHSLSDLLSGLVVPTIVAPTPTDAVWVEETLCGNTDPFTRRACPRRQPGGHGGHGGPAHHVLRAGLFLPPAPQTSGGDSPPVTHSKSRYPAKTSIGKGKWPAIFSSPDRPPGKGPGDEMLRRVEQHLRAMAHAAA